MSVDVPLFIEAWGYCRDKYTEFKRCATTPDRCKTSNGETFSPIPYRKDVLGDRCNPNNEKMGRCLVENSCALRATDCASYTDEKSYKKFMPTDSLCTYLRDESVAFDVDEPIYTQFGSCRNVETGNHFCAYDPLDCDDGEAYATPSETLAADVVCDCSEVHVHACEDSGGGFICALTKEACNPVCYDSVEGCDTPTRDPLSPIAQRTNRENGVSTLDCRLCQKTVISSPIPASTPKPSAPKDVSKPSTSSGAKPSSVAAKPPVSSPTPASTPKPPGETSASAGILPSNDAVVVVWLLCSLVRWFV